jgi:hypothetical protein
VSERMKTSEVRKYERDRGYAAAAVPMWSALTAHMVSDALRGDSWAWPLLGAFLLLLNAVGWWHSRDMLKRHDAARSAP